MRQGGTRPQDFSPLRRKTEPSKYTKHMNKLTWMTLALIAMGACSSKDEPQLPQTTPRESKIETPTTSQGQSSSASSDKAGDSGQDNSTSKEAQTPGQQAPSETDKALRASAVWRGGEAVVYNDVTLEDVLLGSKNISEMSQSLKSYLTITSSTHEGTPYTFTEQELKDIKVVELAISNASTTSRTISFHIEYKGVKSQQASKLTLNLINYYDSKVSIISGEASKYYLGGVFEYLPVFYSRFIKYDQTKYAVILQEETKQASHSGQTLHFSLKVRKHDSEDLLAVVTKTIEGFRPLSGLNGDLQITATNALTTDLKDRVKKFPNKLTEYLGKTIQIWIKMGNFSTKSGEIVWSGDNLVGDHNNDNVRDIYLRRPTFEVVSVERKDNKLQLTLKLKNTADVEVGATFSLSVNL